MFKKYNSIENHYQNKHIKFFLNMYPELERAGYIIEEKLDGANISICINEDNLVRWGKRSSLLDDEQKFMGLENIKPYYNSLINALIEQKNINNYKELQIFGELHGPGIQKRINYGDKLQIKFFDIRVVEDENSFYYDPLTLYIVMSDMEMEHHLVKRFMFFEKLEDALNFDTRIKNDYDSLIEGVVIKPYYNNYHSPVGERFVLKKKNEEFLENEKVKTPKKKKEYSEEVERLETEFNSLINKNRVLSVFSKEGEIEKANQIGDYIKLVLNDAKEDFFKEHSLPEEITKDEEKYIFNQGTKIVGILKEYL
jgi:Rnl2 family RNA ligase